MTLILAFIVLVIAVALWWLLRQGLMTKPWLETGPSPALAAGPGRSVEQVGLGLFLVVVGGLFALFGSAFVMRMDEEVWWWLPLPWVVWLNTAQLILASLFLHMASAAARRGDRTELRRATAVAGLATLGFLVGQLLAWRELTAGGDGLATGPAASFFYLLSGLHGLHIAGGLVALSLAARGGSELVHLKRNLGLCTAYWDFLLIVWAGLLVLFLGWANQVAEICRAALP